MERKDGGVIFVGDVDRMAAAIDEIAVVPWRALAVGRRPAPVPINYPHITCLSDIKDLHDVTPTIE
jgi:hypothetical protein